MSLTAGVALLFRDADFSYFRGSQSNLREESTALAKGLFGLGSFLVVIAIIGGILFG